MESLLLESALIEITEAVQACRNPSDDPVLEVTVNGNATHIVTGDAEIAALEACRDNTHTIKQRMMQQLLTGQVRLI